MHPQTTDPLAVEMSNAPPPTRWFALPIAPLVALVRPRTAGAWLANSSRPAFILFFLGVMLASAAVFDALTIWSATHEEVWVQYSAPQVRSMTYQGASGPITTTYPAFGEMQHRSHSFQDLASNWLARGWNNPLIPLSIGGALLPVGVFTLLAWLGWPWVQRTGSKRRAFGRTFAAITAWVGPAALTAAVLVEGARDNSVSWQNFEFLAQFLTAVGVRVSGEALAANAIAAAIVVNVVYISRITLGAREPLPPLDLPDLCEGCGYELTMLPADALCPECARPVSRSVGPTAPRAASQTQRRASWLHTMLRVLFTPRKFYSTLALRSADPLDQDRLARGFATKTIIALGIGGGIWFLLSNMAELRGSAFLSFDMFLAATFGMQITGLVAFALQRIMAALFFSIWAPTGALRDFRWGVHIYCYETVFIVTAFLFWGAMIDMMIVFGPILTEFLVGKPRTRGFTTPTVELIVGIGGSLALLVAWLWRYGLALRAIRWNNA